MGKKAIEAIEIYVEGRRIRKLAGILRRENNSFGEAGYRFTYEDDYLKWEKAVSVGPELPLTGRSYFGIELFPSFLDRIPSKKNPAYAEYCLATGIEINEDNPFVLLTTIGKRGPSCFIFEPLVEKSFKAEDAVVFRKTLGLSLRQFGLLFDFAPYTIQKIETGKLSGRDVLKRMEIYTRFPEVAWFEMNRNKASIHTKLWEKVRKVFKEMHADHYLHPAQKSDDITIPL